MSPALDPPRSLSQFAARAVGLIGVVLEAVAFWLSIALPFVYVTGYLGTQLMPQLSLPGLHLVGALFAIHSLALVVGNGYNRAPETSERPSVATRRARTQHAD
jgi:hypothetical protein